MQYVPGAWVQVGRLVNAPHKYFLLQTRPYSKTEDIADNKEHKVQTQTLKDFIFQQRIHSVKQLSTELIMPFR